METVIAALITVLAPIMIITSGIHNRDKRDKQLKEIARELHQFDLIETIDARREDRLQKHIKGKSIVSVGTWIFMVSMTLSLTGLLLLISPFKHHEITDTAINILTSFSGIALLMATALLIFGLWHERND